MGDIIWVLVPVTALCIPIVAILTRHQQKMAELLRSGHAQLPQQTQGEIAHLQREVAQLKQIVSQQSILIDDLTDLKKGLNPTNPPNH